MSEHVRRSARFGFLKMRLANMDVEDIWAKLDDQISLGAGRKDADKIGAALDKVDKNLRHAGMLYQVAIDEYDEFMIDFRAAYSEWEVRAKKGLTDKTVKGQVTTDSIKNWIAAHISDFKKWEKVRIGLARTKHLTDNMKKAWESRCASLRKLADGVQQRRVGIETDNLPRRSRGGGDRG